MDKKRKKDNRICGKCGRIKKVVAVLFGNITMTGK